jgi:ligand-binding SRPBCC domain-containing protein
MTIRFELACDISAPREVVFDLSLDVDAHLTSIGRSRERAIAGVTTGRLRLGEEVTWRASHFGIPFTMTSRVAELERPSRFVDEQVRGPFRSFHHEHRFEASGGGTRMNDRICFDAPLGVIGRVVERLVLARYLRHLIAIRNEYLKAEAERRHARTIGPIRT